MSKALERMENVQKETMKKKNETRRESKDDASKTLEIMENGQNEMMNEKMKVRKKSKDGHYGPLRSIFRFLAPLNLSLLSIILSIYMVHILSCFFQ
jgi:hypothetical protein